MNLKQYINRFFESKSKLIPTSLAFCDMRLTPFLENFPFDCELLMLSSWVDFFYELSNSSSSNKKDGKIAVSNIEKIGKIENIRLLKVDSCSSYSDLLKKNKDHSKTFIISSENEADHLVMLYSLKNMNFDKFESFLLDKYWVGKFLRVKPLEKSETGFKGKLPDGTVYFIKSEDHILEKEVTCRVSSYVKSSEGTTLFLKREKQSKRKFLWDLVQ
ncbi:hypothetical protein JXA84_08240 [candidate division WOR-3 bacterium]|nr:hypothetical protein [candidate division WOR-3 bacterium]